MTTMKSKINFNYIIIGILVAIIFLQRAGSSVDSPQEPTVVTKTDTVWKETHDTVVKTVKEIDIKYITPKAPEYTPGEHVDTCRARFAYLLKQHSARRVYKDTIKLDSLGTITVIDTVWLNKLKDRTYIKDYKIPLVTKTITITKQADPKRQLYVGGNLFGDRTTLQSFTPGLIYKDRKDRVYQANVGVNFDGSLMFGAGAYWKINLNKK
jgi:hypothetical protein